MFVAPCLLVRCRCRLIIRITEQAQGATERDTERPRETQGDELEKKRSSAEGDGDRTPNSMVRRHPG